MSNPIMSRNPMFKEGTQTQQTPAGYPAMPGYQPGQGTQGQPGHGYQDQGQYGYQGQGQPQGQYGYQDGYDPRGAFGGPQLAANGEPAMTYQDAMNKTGILLAISVLAGALAWLLLVPGNINDSQLALAYTVVIGGSITAFVLGLIIAFKRSVGAGIAIAYSAIEGAVLGILTGVMEILYPGIAVQTILATVSVVAVCWFLHTTGMVRTTAKGMKYAMVAAFAGLIFAFGNFLLMVTGVINTPWGARSAEIAGVQLGLVIGVIMILVASYFLINDFETAKIAVANRAPASFAWTVGVGIVMTILWIYIEILRIIAILRSE